jgi:ABC-type nitrate/sulfonate/bicarbonate transport system ATPase subunit
MFIQLHHYKRSGTGASILLNIDDISRIEKTDEGSVVYMTVTQTPIHIMESYDQVMDWLNRANLFLQAEIASDKRADSPGKA